MGIMPSTLPVNTHSCPSGETSAAEDSNHALRRCSGIPSNSFRVYATSCSPVASSPAHRAENTPGAPSSASIEMPESSATAHWPVALAHKPRLLQRVLLERHPIFHHILMDPASSALMTSNGRPWRICFISTTLPGLCVAKMSCMWAVYQGSL